MAIMVVESSCKFMVVESYCKFMVVESSCKFKAWFKVKTHLGVWGLLPFFFETSGGKPNSRSQLPLPAMNKGAQPGYGYCLG